MGYLWPTEDQLNEITAAAVPGRTITMLNLLKFREHADYGDKSDAETPCSGKEAFNRYARGVVPIIERLGGNVMFTGNAQSAVIGPTSESWDRVLLVQYPELQTLLNMSSSDEYQAHSHHRSAALADSRLIPILAD